MSSRFQARKGNTAQNVAFTGAIGELTYDTEKKQIRVHDGETVGGITLAKTSEATPNATETIAGKAKIATTAIAQAGVNDTDFLTPKKLRDALRATGSAPISAVRAHCTFNGASAPVIQNESNVLSITVAGSTFALLKFTVIFKVPMPTKDYAIAGFCADTSNSNRLASITMNPEDIVSKTANGFDFYARYASGGSSNIASSLITFMIVC